MRFSWNLPGILLFCLGGTVLSSCGTLDTTTQMGGSIQGTELTLSGATSTLAGTAGASGSADGTGASAGFNDPIGVTTDGKNLYVADSGNHTIRKIVIATGAVTTLAGTAGSSGTSDGIGASAAFKNPYGITMDGSNLYVADSGNHTIRKVVIATKVVTTLAGTAGTSGSNDNTGTSAMFNTPYGITTNGTNLYVADSGNHTIRKVVIATGDVTTLAGAAGFSGSVDGTGASARFNGPHGITSDGANLYVADSGNHTIRRVVAKVVSAIGDTTTVAGIAGSSGSTDGTGSTSRFNIPSGITTDGKALLVSDTGNNTVRAIE